MIIFYTYEYSGRGRLGLGRIRLGGSVDIG